MGGRWIHSSPNIGCHPVMYNLASYFSKQFSKFSIPQLNRLHQMVDRRSELSRLRPIPSTLHSYGKCYDVSNLEYPVWPAIQVKQLVSLVSGNSRTAAQIRQTRVEIEKVCWAACALNARTWRWFLPGGHDTVYLNRIIYHWNMLNNPHTKLRPTTVDSKKQSEVKTAKRGCRINDT